MSTKTKSNSSNQITYDPTAMGQYQSNISTAFPIFQQYAQNPYSNPFYQRNLGMLSGQAAQAGQNAMSNILQRARQSGMSSGTLQPFLQSQMAGAARGTSSLQNQAQFQAMGQANNQQMQSLQALMSFQPLMTGSNAQSTQTTSGTGTWLPQLAGAAIGGLTGGLGSSLSGLMGFGRPSTAAVNQAGLGSLSSMGSPSFWSTVSPSPGAPTGMGSLGAYNPLMVPGMMPGANPFGF